MAQITNFFLGANSGSGFQNLFSEIMDPETAFDIMILKGGPGVGKNTFMREIGRTMEQAGADVEYLWCSGDPDSLDGVVIPALRCAVCDGTSPHAVEPKYPAAVDRYVDLGRFYDLPAAKVQAGEVKRHTRDYQDAYGRAYRCLKAARQVELDTVAEVSRNFDRQRAARQEQQLLRQNQELQQQRMEALRTAYEDQRRLTHDFKNELSVLLGLLHENQTSRAVELLQDLQSEVLGEAQVVDTQNPLLDAILNRVIENHKRGRRTWIYIDEIYLFFANEYSSNFLEESWKRFRKKNAAATGITQNVTDCLRSPTAKNMLANSEFLLMLSQAPTDQQELVKMLRISEEQLSYISNAESGHGLIKVGGAKVPFINQFPRNTALYRLMTTKPGESL